MGLSNSHKVFLALVRGGLWETEVTLKNFSQIDYSTVTTIAEEQGVIGLVVTGLEHSDAKAPQGVVLNIVRSVLEIEQRNKLMNNFIADIATKMEDEGINMLLVKGQCVAQCYEKPLWRSSGDVDLLLSEDNYQKAKAFLLPLSSGNKNEERYSKHLGMNIGSWYVEIHGSLRSGLSERVDKEIDAVQNELFNGGKVRSWMNGNSQVFLPAADEDVFLVFTHFIKHFYKEGLGLRQVCDWSRLLWTHRETIDTHLLEQRICKSGLKNEWMGFASVAVDHLGMPVEAMPFYSEDKKWSRKAEKIVTFILDGITGNKYKDTMQLALIYPGNTMKFLPGILWHLNWLKIKERLFGEER